MIKVFLREKKLKHGKRGLYLDFYPPVLNPDTRQQTRREHLRLYIFDRPKTETEKNHNKETKLLGENIRAQRQLDLQAGVYGFVLIQNKQKDFIKYFDELIEAAKKKSHSTYDIWLAVGNHLKDYTGGACRFADMTEKFCAGFKDYLLNEAKITNNSAATYFDKFKSAARQAFEAHFLPDNPTKNIKSIKLTETQREFLTLAELQALANTPFEFEDIRRAALFSALTGLSYSDISKLLWSEVRHSRELGFHIRFRQKKTGSPETLPVSDEAAELLGERGADSDKVFPKLMKWHRDRLGEWASAAGISKKITFHCFRHTFATLQLMAGTGILTVSRMLGHRNLSTTQIYTRIIDAEKKEAAGKISLK